MRYSLVHGVENGETPQVYSLYGGVEGLPLRQPAIKRLLPPVFVPVAVMATVAILVALFPPHLTPNVPVAPSNKQKSGQGNGSGTAKTSAAALASRLKQAPGSPAATGSSNSSTGSAGTGPATTYSTLSQPLSSGPSLIGGMGGGPSSLSTGGSGTSPSLSTGTGGTSASGSGGTSSGINATASATTPLSPTPLVQANVGASTSSVGASATATAPIVNQPLSASVDPSL